MRVGIDQAGDDEAVAGVDRRGGPGSIAAVTERGNDAIPYLEVDPLQPKPLLGEIPPNPPLIKGGWGELAERTRQYPTPCEQRCPWPGLFTNPS